MKGVSQETLPWGGFFLAKRVFASDFDAFFYEKGEPITSEDANNQLQ